jgi:hypothetical protein
MSEYQYHEWQAIDRILTPGEQAVVYNLFSHIELSSSLAVGTYHWSDFRYDPKQVFLNFSMLLYLANHPAANRARRVKITGVIFSFCCHNLN